MNQDVDYTQLYDMPPEGWPAYRRKLAMRKPGEGAYEAVSTEEV